MDTSHLQPDAWPPQTHAMSVGSHHEHNTDSHSDHHDEQSSHDHHHFSEERRAPSVANPSRIGEPRGHRKLVLCFDGTGNKFGGDDSDSNILKIFRCLDRDCSDQCE